MARVSKAVSEMAAAKVRANPRGAPITLDAVDVSVDLPMLDEVVNPLDELANLIPEPPPPPIAPPKASDPFCILDDQPINSGLVVLQWSGEPAYPHLQSPKGVVDVPHDDLAWKLPLGAEIKRTGEKSFVATQRDDQLGKPRLVCSSAVEACQRFKQHFHNERD